MKSSIKNTVLYIALALIAQPGNAISADITGAEGRIANASSEFADKFFTVLRDVVTKPSAYIEVDNGRNVYSHLKDKDAGMMVGGKKSLQLSEGSFDGSSEFMIGPMFSVHNGNDLVINSKFLFGLTHSEAVTSGQTNSGTGGAYGFTADYDSVTEYKTDFMINADIAFKNKLSDSIFRSYGIMPLPVLSINHKVVSYDSKVKEKRWNYGSQGQNAADARSGPSSELSEGTSGRIGVSELGLGLSIRPMEKKIPEMFFGYKKGLDEDHGLFFFGLSMDISGGDGNSSSSANPPGGQGNSPDAGNSKPKTGG